ncbi:MAG: hypothetical protein Q4E62_09465 [Sutterellaceae bacterium]|nr:hypothetical protein [Sutterellaceae bacterium]
MTPEIYRVGGCVRDELLRRQGVNIPCGDRDWVVVGATPEWMIEQGFMPVGADFPVFLHPKTHEEYALARTERKTARGYHGFRFYAQSDVTLEDDLRRRDLTINAMAQDKDGNVIDPYGGQTDLNARIFRHVSQAFAEDPVRILRLARFAARFPDFKVAPETNALAQSMVQNGETDALVAERVYKEFSRAFAETNPQRTLEVLRDCGYWQRSFGDIELTQTLLTQIERAAARPDHGDVVTALIFGQCQDTQKVRNRMKALRADSVTTSLCELVSRLLQPILSARSAEDFARIFTQGDVLRRADRFDRFMAVIAAVAPDFDFGRLALAREAFVGVDAAAIVRTIDNPAKIASALNEARVQAVKEVLEKK